MWCFCFINLAQSGFPPCNTVCLPSHAEGQLHIFKAGGQFNDHTRGWSKGPYHTPKANAIRREKGKGWGLDTPAGSSIAGVQASVSTAAANTAQRSQSVWKSPMYPSIAFFSLSTSVTEVPLNTLLCWWLILIHGRSGKASLPVLETGGE